MDTLVTLQEIDTRRAHLELRDQDFYALLPRYILLRIGQAGGTPFPCLDEVTVRPNDVSMRLRDLPDHCVQICFRFAFQKVRHIITHPRRG